MDLNEDIIRRWLSQMAEDAPPQLDPSKVDSSDLGNRAGEAEPQGDLVRRLWLVQGLLSTLDAKHAPDALDQRVQDVVQGQADADLDWETLDAEWSEGVVVPGEGAGAESVAGSGSDVPVVAPEFLDRIVEQRLSEIEQQLKRERIESKKGYDRRRRLSSRRGLRFASLMGAAALVLFLMPWSALYQGEAKAPLRVIQHTSVESLFSAHPDSVQMATRSGDFGALMGLSIPEGTEGEIR